jgi:hypothetical protein
MVRRLSACGEGPSNAAELPAIASMANCSVDSLANPGAILAGYATVAQFARGRFIRRFVLL